MAQSVRPRAILTDTGGTIFDWHTAVTAALASRAASLSPSQSTPAPPDWAEVTRAWRRLSMSRVNSGLPTDPTTGLVRRGTDMDAVLRDTLPPALAEHGLPAPSEEDTAALVAAWRTMDPWPDVVHSIARLRASGLVVVPFSVLKCALVLACSRKCGVAWDTIFGCEQMGVYKPDPAAYTTALRWLDLEPGDAMMLASHTFDLKGAAGVGLRTCFVKRGDEWGKDVETKEEDRQAWEGCDMSVESLEELCERMGA